MVPAAFWRTVASGCGSRRLAAVLKHLAQRKVRRFQMRLQQSEIGFGKARKNSVWDAPVGR